MLKILFIIKKIEEFNNYFKKMILKESQVLLIQFSVNCKKVNTYSWHVCHTLPLILVCTK